MVLKNYCINFRTLSMLFTTIAMASFISSNAQQFVSTSPQNKNVVLEEYTGLNCQYCPQGHKIAQSIKDQAPNDVVLVNIHTGGFAQPDDGQPDYRTNFGEDLANNANVSSYPSATVNRTPYDGDLALGRGDWDDAANQVLNESSPVNIAIQTDINEDTRELTVDVEAYYTDSSNVSENKIHIALLQNNVPGPQTSSGDYASNELKNGQYKHQHMLRHLLTGQWGDKINHPYEDSLFKKTYTYQIPEDYNSIPAKLQFLEVAAYVSQDRKNVLTGTSEKVQVDKDKLVDLSTSKDFQNPSDLCDAKIKPEVAITNNDTTTVNSFQAIVEVNGQRSSKSFNGTLDKGQTTTVSFSEKNLTQGEYDVKFIGLENINNGDAYDYNIDNDVIASAEGLAFQENAFKGEHKFGFESQQEPNNLALTNNTLIQLVYGGNQRQFGANSSSGAILQYMRSNFGTGRVTFGRQDISSIDRPHFDFFYAYAKGNGSATPTITLEVSSDCGSSWTQIGSKTAKETNSSFTPTQQNPIFLTSASDEYNKDSFSLVDLSNKEDLIFRLKAQPNGDGNALWLDDMEFRSGKDTSTSSSVTSHDFSAEVDFYPNPVQKQANLTLKVKEKTNFSGEIVNSVGKNVKTLPSKELNTGKHTFNLNLSNLAPGMYSVNLHTKDQTKSIKFTVSE